MQKNNEIKSLTNKQIKKKPIKRINRKYFE